MSSTETKTIIRKAHNKENPYAQISKSLLRDRRLSAKAMGIMCYLLGLPDHWRLCIRELATHFSDGEKSIKAGLKELQLLGYIERFQHRQRGGVFGVIEMLIHEEPIFAAPAVIEVSPRAQNRPPDSPRAQKRPAVKRPAVKGTLVNTDPIETDFIKNIQQGDVVVSDINCLERAAKMDELLELDMSKKIAVELIKGYSITRIAEAILDSKHPKVRDRAAHIYSFLIEGWKLRDQFKKEKLSLDMEAESKKIIDSVNALVSNRASDEVARMYLGILKGKVDKNNRTSGSMLKVGEI